MIDQDQVNMERRDTLLQRNACSVPFEPLQSKWKKLRNHWMNAAMAACACCCCSVSVAVEEADGITVVSGGLPMMMGANEDATDDGTPAEVNTPTTDVLSSSGPGKVVGEEAGVEWSVADGDVVVPVVTSEDTEFGKLEVSVVVNATTDSRDNGSVEVVGDCGWLERDRPVDVPVGVLLLLEPVCVVVVVAELDDEGSLAALEDVVIRLELVSVVDSSTDDV